MERGEVTGTKPARRFHHGFLPTDSRGCSLTRDKSPRSIVSRHTSSGKAHPAKQPGWVSQGRRAATPTLPRAPRNKLGHYSLPDPQTLWSRGWPRQASPESWLNSPEKPWVSKCQMREARLCGHCDHVATPWLATPPYPAACCLISFLYHGGEEERHYEQESGVTSWKPGFPRGLLLA